MGGMLTVFTVLFQAAPVFLPMIGLALSPLSTLPIILAGYFHLSLGIAVYLASAFLLAFVHIQESIILLFTTGLLGVGIGTFLFRKGMIISILFSSTLLFSGILLLTYVVAISPFGNNTPSNSFLITCIIFGLFSFLYASIWNVCIKKFINYLINIKVIKT